MPNTIMPSMSGIYGVKVKPRTPKVRIFMPCCHDMKAACVETVAWRSSVVDLTKGATRGPVPPTNIVAKEENIPTLVNVIHEAFIALVAGPHRVHSIKRPIMPCNMYLGSANTT